MKYPNRIVALLTSLLLLCAFIPGAAAETKAPEIATTPSGSVAYAESRTVQKLGFAEENMDYYMESTLTTEQVGVSVQTKELVSASLGDQAKDYKDYQKLTDPETGAYTINYVEGSTTYRYYSNGQPGTKQVGLRAHEGGTQLPHPYNPEQDTLSVGTTTVDGAAYYSETAVVSMTGSASRRTVTYCFEEDAVRCIIEEMTTPNGDVWRYIHQIKAFAATCDAGQMVLPEGFPQGYTFQT